MGHNRLVTIKDANGRLYAVDKWNKDGGSPMTNAWKYPSKVVDIDEGRRLDQWETANSPQAAFSSISSDLEVAIEGLERLLIDYHVAPETVIVTRHASFSADSLADSVDVDAEFINSSEQSIRR